MKMQSTYQRVAEWNNRCNKTPLEIGTEEYWKSLEDQMERILEEAQETVDAIKARDLTEVLDGGVDMDVVVSGLNYLMGLDYSEAVDRVLSNNDMKYTEDFDVAVETALFYCDKGLECDIQEVLVEGDGMTSMDKEFFSVHRQSDNKIMKLLDHPRVSLADLVPNFKEEGAQV